MYIKLFVLARFIICNISQIYQQALKCSGMHVTEKNITYFWMDQHMYGAGVATWEFFVYIYTMQFVCILGV